MFSNSNKHHRSLSLAAALLGLFAYVPARAAIATNAASATDLAQNLLGSGVTISGVTYTGDATAGGTFTGGTADLIGFDKGIILGSGAVANVIGPNDSGSETTSFESAGDADLTALSGNPTLDATVLEFDFIPDADKVFFSYVFGSEEYSEYVNSPFNDVFGFFINGVNCATVEGLPVAVNTINGGNPFGAANSSHPELFVYNGDAHLDTQLDGLTKVLVCESAVTKGATNHVKLAIADASDSALDSDVFLKAGSFSTTPPDDLDTTPPTCQVPTAIIAGPPKKVQATVQDTGSGIASIVSLTLVNATMDDPAPVAGTKDPVVVTFTKVNQAKSSTFTMRITDVAGNFTDCDPTVAGEVDAGDPAPSAGCSQGVGGLIGLLGLAAAGLLRRRR